jgi:hypothetical protein
MRREKGIIGPPEEEDPVLFRDAVWIWNGFQMLIETRDYGMGGPMHIKCIEIESYLRLIGIDDEDDIPLFFYCVMRLDGLWLSDYYEKQEHKKKIEEQRNRARR